MFTKDGTELICYPCAKESKNYIVPNGVIKIDAFSFQDCINLQSVTIPNSVTKLWEHAFYGDTNITATYKGKTYTHDNIDDIYTVIVGGLSSS